MEVRRFLSTVWGKFTLPVFLLAVTALSARAVPVTQVGGVNFQYTATDVNGVLTVSFTNPFNFVNKINNSLISQEPASFPQLTLTTSLIDDIPGLSGHFTPGGNSEQWGFPSLSPAGAPNVVFNYGITSGSVFADGLTLTGSVSLAPGSATSFTLGGTTYDFSGFENPGSITLSLGTQDSTGVLIYNTLKSGNGSFNGSGQFSQNVTTDATVPDTGATAFLFGFSLAALAFLRRKMAC